MVESFSSYVLRIFSFVFLMSIQVLRSAVWHKSSNFS